jgi:PTH1 family peptidyl-tRNA hydrolase
VAVFFQCATLLLMSFVIAGLGNPGQEYVDTRHNVGRMVVDAFVKAQGFPELESSKMLKALSTEGKIKKEKVLVIEPETFMNKSGESVGKLVKTKKAASQLVVVHDDLDLPLGRIKVSFNKSSGGHKGVESVIKAVKTQEFIRVRVGISPETAGGKLKKPQGDEVVNDFIVDPFKKAEADVVKSAAKRGAEALAVIITEGRDKAMGEFNSL